MTLSLPYPNERQQFRFDIVPGSPVHFTIERIPEGNIPSWKKGCTSRISRRILKQHLCTVEAIRTNDGRLGVEPKERILKKSCASAFFPLTTSLLVTILGLIA
jgi:hypothetical protein